MEEVEVVDVSPKPPEKPASETERKKSRVRRFSATQIVSWQETKHELGERQKEVRDLIAASRNGLTCQEIADALHLPLHSGRCTELADLGMIIDSHRRAYNAKTNRYVRIWLAQPKEQRTLAEFVR